MNRFIRYALIIFLGILLTITIGVWMGFNNNYDKVSKVIEDDSLSSSVSVYRDDFGTPIIVGSSLDDVAFAQGYEHARDRLWQLEFTRSVANGELSRLFGPDLIESDTFLKTLDLKANAENIWNITSSEVKNVISAYVSGINKYIKEHENQLPVEFQVLGVKPKLWTEYDVFGVQGVMAYDLAFRGVAKELIFQDLYKKVGMRNAIELAGMQTPFVKDFLLHYNSSMDGNPPQQLSLFEGVPYKFLSLIGSEYGVGSNNWVISGSKTESGNPIIANDPHLGLTTPGIWWKVHLIVRYGEKTTFNVEGFALPGAPLVVVGHNEYVAWGVTNTQTDAVDLFYFRNNETHYLVGNTWYPYKITNKTIEVKGAENRVITVKSTNFGPIMNFDGSEYAVKWVLHQGYPHDLIFTAIYDINHAKSVDEIHDALINWSVPGQNIVFADINGNIAYQYTGIIPIRKTGYGIIPHNASTGMYDWIGTENYSRQLYVKNPDKGFWETANQRVDTRNLLYIDEFYTSAYRARRIEQVLANNTKFDNPDGKFSLDDVKRLQLDVYDTSYDDYIVPNLDAINNGNYNIETKLLERVLKEINDFDGYMNLDTIGGTIASTFRLLFVENTISDEIGTENAYQYNYMATRSIGNWTVHDRTNQWFDNITTDAVENADNIAQVSFEQTINYLIDNFGDNPDKWQWGEIHQVSFDHIMGSVLPFLNNGPEPNRGTTYTVNVGSAPYILEDGSIDYKQIHGVSMRFVAEVEKTWSNVYGVTPPGEIGDVASKHYSDGFNIWLDGTYSHWIFDFNGVDQTYKVITIYRRPE